MPKSTLLLVIVAAILTGGLTALTLTVGRTRPRLTTALKGIVATLIPLTLVGTVVTDPKFYLDRPALLVYMGAPVLIGVIWTAYKMEAGNPGRISGLLRGNQGRRRTTTRPRQPRVVQSFPRALRGWLNLAIFEDKVRYRFIHIGAITAGWVVAATFPTPLAYAVPFGIVLISTTRWMKVQGTRNQVLTRVYAIAASHLDYSKAVNSRLTSGGHQFASHTGSINVEWADLTTPTRITVAFPVTFAKTNLEKRNTFEDEFDATLPGAGWKFDWDTTATTVTITTATYSDNVRWEMRTPEKWSQFYVGDQLDDGSQVTFDLESESPHGIVAGETGSGKASRLSELIATPEGWRLFGDIHPGDFVFGMDGSAVRVVFETKPELRDEYEVVFSDGATVVASEDHLWFTETRDVRKARSKQKGDYKGVQRRSRLDPDVVERLRADAAKAGPDDAVTATDAAMLAGISASTSWFRDVMAGLPVVARLQDDRVFEYADQEVVQEQTVLRYPARAALESFARSWSIKGQARANLEAALADLTFETVTAAEVASIIGIDVKTARRRLWGSGLTGVEVKEKVRLVVPAKTVTRKASAVALYPKAALFRALADEGEKAAHDLRDRMSTGAVRTTRQIMETLHAADGAVNHSIPVARPLQLPESDLPIPPYTLGAWLGDGSNRQATIVGIDHQVADNIRADGYELNEYSTARHAELGRHPDYRAWGILGLHRQLRLMGLLKTRYDVASTKRIPAIYLRASEAQRRALLAGLLDTDGTVAPQGTVQFTNTNRDVAYGVHELALTLGYRATIIEGRAVLDGRDCGPKWTVSFTTTDEVFRLDRKNQALRERTAGFNEEKNNSRYIVDVRPTGKQSLMKCIQVDSAEHLYLIGEHLIPTHNTEAMFVIAAQALLKGWDLAICDPKETGWAMWTRRRRPTNEAGHDTGAAKLRPGDARPGVIEHAVELYGIRDVLSRCVEEMQRRKKVNGANKVVKWTELSDEVKEAENIKPLMVVVDEALSLFDMEKGGTDEIKERNDVRGQSLGLLQKLIVEARALGIHVLLGIQRPDAAVLGGAMRSNLGARIACGVMEPSGYQMMFQVQSGVPRLVVNGPDGKKVIGRALVRSSPGQPIVPVQVAWLGKGQKDLEDVAPMPPEPEQEDETPTGPFNPYAQFDDPSPWLRDTPGADDPPPWETIEPARPAAPVGAADAPPWEKAAPEAPPWEKATVDTPPWEKADLTPAAEAPPWEKVAPVADTPPWDVPAPVETPPWEKAAPADPPPWETFEEEGASDDVDDAEDLADLMSEVPSPGRGGAGRGRAVRPAGAPTPSGAPADHGAAWLTPAPAWEPYSEPTVDVEPLVDDRASADVALAETTPLAAPESGASRADGDGADEWWG